MHTLATNISTEATTTWRVVFQTCGGKLYIHSLKLHLSDNGSITLQKLRNAYRQRRTRHPYNYWDKTLFFWEPFIEIAILSPNSTHDLEQQKNARQVFVTNRREDLELTAAFRDPQLLESTGNFVKENARFAVDNTSPSMKKDVLLVGLRVNWIGVLALAFLNLFICLGPGILVGYLSRRVDLGVAVTSGVAAVLVYIQAVLILLYK